MGKRLCWLSWYDSSGRVMTKSWGVLDPLSRSLKTEEANLFQEPLPGPRSGGSRKMPCKLPNFGVICDTYFPLLLAAAPLKPARRPRSRPRAIDFPLLLAAAPLKPHS